MIEIVRGTNPTITIKMRDITLVPCFTETVNGEPEVRRSYVTIRSDIDDTGSIDRESGEMQIDIGSGSESVDEDGNIFTVTEHEASVKLSQAYTSKLVNNVYFLQFNLIDDEHNQFAVDSSPILLQVRRNLLSL